MDFWSVLQQVMAYFYRKTKHGYKCSIKEDGGDLYGTGASSEAKTGKYKRKTILNWHMKRSTNFVKANPELLNG